MFYVFLLNIFINKKKKKGRSGPYPYPLDRIGWYFCIFIPGVSVH